MSSSPEWRKYRPKRFRLFAVDRPQYNYLKNAEMLSMLNNVPAYQRHGISDAIWRKLAPLLPAALGKAGRPPDDD